MRYEVPVFVDRVRPIFTHPVMVLRVWNTVCPVTDSVGVARLGIGGLDSIPRDLRQAACHILQQWRAFTKAQAAVFFVKYDGKIYAGEAVDKLKP